MLRSVFIGCLLALAATAPASAHPAHATGRFWFSKPETHGSRKLAGDYTHINTTYRYHSRERRGLLGFLHFGSQHPGIAARHKGKANKTQGHTQPRNSSRKHTSGLF